MFKVSFKADDQWSNWFHDARLMGNIVEVTDKYGQIRRGIIYRNDRTRANVYPLGKDPHCILDEVYYSNIVTAQIVGDGPNPPPVFIPDWEIWPDKYKEDKE